MGTGCQDSLERWQVSACGLSAHPTGSRLGVEAGSQHRSLSVSLPDTAGHPGIHQGDLSEPRVATGRPRIMPTRKCQG